MMKYLFSCLILLFALNASASTVYDRIHILVNEHVITQNEIEIRMIEFARQQRRTSLTDQQAQQFRAQVIKLLIEEALLDQRADKLNIVLSEEQLDTEVDHYRKQNRLSQIEFEELLERRNLTLADFKNGYLKRTRRSMVVNQEIRSQIVISDEQLKALYEQGEGIPIRIRARHILLILNKDASVEEAAKVRERLIWIKNQILAGKSFTEMADRYSQDPSVKTNHGDLGFFGKGDMVREFADVAFVLEKGVLSEPVRSPFGFHLIEVMERKEGVRQDFEMVREKLYQQEYRKVFEKKYQAYISNLKKKANIIKR